AGEPSLTTDRRQEVVAAGEDLVRITLVANVPQDLVAGRFEHPVQSDAELHRAQIGPEVRALVAGDSIQDTLTDLVRERPQLVCWQRAEICGRADLAEYGQDDLLLLSWTAIAARITPACANCAHKAAPPRWQPPCAVASTLPLDHVIRQGGQLLRYSAGKSRLRLFGTLPCKGTSAFETVQRRVRRFLQPLVAPGDLSQRIRISHHVQNVVGDLEGEPERLAVSGEVVEQSRSGSGCNRADAQRGDQQRARLGAMDRLQPRAVDPYALR